VTVAHSDRRELLKLLKAIGPGDVVTVTRIDRFARSTFDLFAIVKQIVDAKAQFRSLAEPWADTGTSTGRLMIAVLGGLADVERDLIRTRTGLVVTFVPKVPLRDLWNINVLFDTIGGNSLRTKRTLLFSNWSAIWRRRWAGTRAESAKSRHFKDQTAL
jgi:hypothetical protein